MNTLVLGRNIYKARKDRGLSSDKLAELCDVTPSYLRQVEAGNKTPSLSFFVILCDQLQVTPSSLLSGVVQVKEDGREELEILSQKATPSQMKLISALIKAAVENCE